MRSFLHTMIRVRDLDKSIAFYKLLGMKELRRCEVREGRYTLVYIGFDDNDHGQAEIELTFNWDQETDYEIGNGFGHFAIAVPHVASAVEEIRQGGGKITREAGTLRYGTITIAFVEDPDGYKVELIEKTISAPE